MWSRNGHLEYYLLPAWCQVVQHNRVHATVPGCSVYGSSSLTQVATPSCQQPHGDVQAANWRVCCARNLLCCDRKVEELVHEEAAKKAGVQLIRRFTGGGTVIVDHNTVFAGLIMHAPDLPGEIECYPRPIMDWTREFYNGVFGAYGEFSLKSQGQFQLSSRALYWQTLRIVLSACCQYIVLALISHGCQLNASPPQSLTRQAVSIQMPDHIIVSYLLALFSSDVQCLSWMARISHWSFNADYTLGEKKFAGNAQAITKQRFCHHTSFLWDFADSNMRLLKHPAKAPEYRQVAFPSTVSRQQLFKWMYDSCIVCNPFAWLKLLLLMWDIHVNHCMAGSMLCICLVNLLIIGDWFPTGQKPSGLPLQVEGCCTLSHCYHIWHQPRAPEARIQDRGMSKLSIRMRTRPCASLMLLSHYLTMTLLHATAALSPPPTKSLELWSFLRGSTQHFAFNNIWLEAMSKQCKNLRRGLDFAGYWYWRGRSSPGREISTEQQATVQLRYIWGALHD